MLAVPVLPRGRQAPTACDHGCILVLYEGSGLFSQRTTNIPEMELRITEAVIPVTRDILEENLTKNGMRIRRLFFCLCWML